MGMEILCAGWVGEKLCVVVNDDNLGYLVLVGLVGVRGGVVEVPKEGERGWGGRRWGRWW